MAKVDVVVPCYNYARFLETCVSSVLTQSVTDVRVLIIDDASADDSAAVAEQLAHADSRVTFVRHPVNMGHIATYNEGIAWASSDYFLLLSADDQLVPGALQRAVEIMDANPDVVLTHGDGIEWWDAQPLPTIAVSEGNAWARHDLLRTTCVSGKNLVCTPTALVRTSIQKRVGGYRKSLPHAGDLEMWLRFAASGSVVRVNAVQAIYRKHSMAMSNAYYASMLDDYRQVQLAFETFFDEYDERLGYSRDLRKTAREALGGAVFRHGVRLLRQARLKDGARLIHSATDIDRRLRYRPPLWQLFKIPGPAGRDRLKSMLREAANRLFKVRPGTLRHL